MNGGLDLGVQAVVGGHVVWHAENDRSAARVLAHHWPHVPNLGDVTSVDWRAVEPVDVLTGGFPCQDVSTAGKRAGLADGTRSGLWSHMAAAVDALRPSLVIVENVRGLLSATAHRPAHVRDVGCGLCDVETADRPALRALGAVLGDLAELGYDARWTSLRAADVGAPHGRLRVFLVAWPAADTTGGQLPRTTPTGAVRLAAERGDFAAADTNRRRQGFEQDTRGLGRVDRGDEGPPRERERPRTEPGDRGGTAAADATGDGRHEGRAEPARVVGGPHAAERGPAADADAGAPQEREGDAPVRGRWAEQPAWTRTSPGTAAWGKYEPAIRRWEAILGRPAPAPTEPTGRDGGPRLSPRFVEWMMGLPAGWVTDVPGVSRNAQLTALGNGVVPQQAAEALRRLLEPAAEWVAS